MRIESPILTEELGFPLETEGRVEIYKELARPIYEKLEESKLGTAFVELSDITKADVQLIRSGVRHYINKYATDYAYTFYTKILTDPKNGSHHILIFSKKKWDEIVWEEVSSKYRVIGYNAKRCQAML